MESFARDKRGHNESNITSKLPRRHFDRIAIAQALRNAIVDAAGIDHGIDQPHADADDDHEEHEQHQVRALALVIAFLFRRRLVHSMHRRACHGLLDLRDQLLERERLSEGWLTADNVCMARPIAGLVPVENDPLLKWRQRSLRDATVSAYGHHARRQYGGNGQPAMNDEQPAA